ncbi:B12-binding domain-containing protein [Thermorudis peleae]|uniref:B12-binding domain-containing protein n=1 Tax=Thermorudis peleae TaxID=1382356 RepID=UPI00056F3F49|nr:B12-binding domain-containing protein [Thermorudis peleae]
MHDAVESGMTLPVLFEYVFAPALRELGERWARGEITIGQEHEVSAAIRELVTMLTSQTPRPTITREPVVAACVKVNFTSLAFICRLPA